MAKKTEKENLQGGGGQPPKVEEAPPEAPKDELAKKTDYPKGSCRIKVANCKLNGADDEGFFWRAGECVTADPRLIALARSHETWSVEEL